MASYIKKDDDSQTASRIKKENEDMAAAIIESYECLSPESKKRSKQDVNESLEKIFAASSPNVTPEKNKKSSTIEVSSDSDEDSKKIKSIKGIFKSPKPSTSKEKVKRSSVFEMDEKPETHGKSSKKRAMRQEDSDSDENEEYIRSSMYQEILKNSKHGSCGDKTLTHMCPGVAVIVKKKGRAARCGNKTCREDLNVGDTVAIMIGSYSGNFKKVYFCPEISCCKKRFSLDNIESPTKYVAACFIGKREMKRLKTEFSDSLEIQDCDSHM